MYTHFESLVDCFRHRIPLPRDALFNMSEPFEHAFERLPIEDKRMIWRELSTGIMDTFIMGPEAMTVWAYQYPDQYDLLIPLYAYFFEVSWPADYLHRLPTPWVERIVEQVAQHDYLLAHPLGLEYAVQTSCRVLPKDPCLISFFPHRLDHLSPSFWALWFKDVNLFFEQRRPDTSYTFIEQMIQRGMHSDTIQYLLTAWMNVHHDRFYEDIDAFLSPTTLNFLVDYPGVKEHLEDIAHQVEQQVILFGRPFKDYCTLYRYLPIDAFIASCLYLGAIDESLDLMLMEQTLTRYKEQNPVHAVFLERFQSQRLTLLRLQGNQATTTAIFTALTQILLGLDSSFFSIEEEWKNAQEQGNEHLFLEQLRQLLITSQSTLSLTEGTLYV